MPNADSIHDPSTLHPRGQNVDRPRPHAPIRARGWTKIHVVDGV